MDCVGHPLSGLFKSEASLRGLSYPAAIAEALDTTSYAGLGCPPWPSTTSQPQPTHPNTHSR